jgi:hypothetical protein
MQSGLKGKIYLCKWRGIVSIPLSTLEKTDSKN